MLLRSAASAFALVVVSSTITACEITATDDFVGPCLATFPCQTGEVKVDSCSVNGSCYDAMDSCGAPATCERQITCGAAGGQCSGDDVRVDACPGDADCYAKDCPGANGGTFSTTCVTKATCTAKTVCDQGDSEVASCPSGASCYQALGCSGAITCADEGLNHGCPADPPGNGTSVCTFPRPAQCQYDPCTLFHCVEGGDCCTWELETICPP